ncbi:MAG TPA: threonine synthase [Woeseiaceae bacterium]|nr:threonine synthase [Woeseiaceae bacterium]
MNYFSTRGAGPVSLHDALRQGIADDGGLYLPEYWPNFSLDDFVPGASIQTVAETLLRPFFAGSPLAPELGAILDETFRFPIPEQALPGANASMLELFHGPTAAFKDVGAGFLAACLSRLEGDADSPLCILVATSGDTGGAVAAAFDQKPGMRVVVLFPAGRVSERQEKQLCCWGDNVLSLKVRGSFDDCQALVKAALADDDLQQRYRFSSANSINIGRLLPQATYYAAASLSHFRARGTCPGFVIPTGNLGNALACVLVRKMGLPVGPIMLATNANRSIPDYFASLEWQPRPSIATLASAMDVGDPSNMERLRHVLGDAEVLREELAVVSVSDVDIRKEIKRSYSEFGLSVCPHTATALHAWRTMDARTRESAHWILVATAHAAKFETIVEPITGSTIPLPAELADILSRPSSSILIEPTRDAFANALGRNF